MLLFMYSLVISVAMSHSACALLDHDMTLGGVSAFLLCLEATDNFVHSH